MAYRNVVKAFRKVEPKVTVNLIEASDRDDLLARLSTSFAGGNPPDLFLLNCFYGQFAARGVLAPVEKRVDDSRSSSRRTSINPRSTRSDSEERSRLPQNISSLVVYYNKDLFAKAGVPEPQAGGPGTSSSRRASRSPRTPTETARPTCTASASSRQSSASRRWCGERR